MDSEANRKPNATRASKWIECPINIAIIKYWGKRNEQLNLPLNDSLSVTLDARLLHTITCVRDAPPPADAPAGSQLAVTDHQILDVSVQSSRRPPHAMKLKARTRTLIDLVAQLSRTRNSGAGSSGSDDSATAPETPLRLRPLLVETANSFPTGAGLASSASGLSALALAVAYHYGLEPLGDQPLLTELSALVRRGSGSACRSLFGGFVEWRRGERADGADSVAVQLAPASAWPSLRIIVLVLSDTEKETPSTEGMQRTANTCRLLQYRVEHTVPARLETLRKAIRERDFDTFGRIAMEDSNEFHAMCLATYPPLHYMNDCSFRVVDAVHRLNRELAEGDGDAGGRQQLHAAYTFDAGPNAVLFTLAEYEPLVLAMLEHMCEPRVELEGLEQLRPDASSTLGSGLRSPKLAYLEHESRLPRGAVKRIICTRLGDGPRLYDGPPTANE